MALSPLLVWAYWPSLVELVSRWSTDPQYSHGFLVPPFACFLLWHRRAVLAGSGLTPSWAGMWLLAGAAMCRAVGSFFFLPWLDGLTLLPTLAGVCVLAGGWGAFYWALPSLAFLTFSLPLPYGLEVALSLPLQQFATRASTYTLETLGFPAFSEGNVILLNDVEIGVIEACNGLSMLVTFFTLSFGLILLIQRHWTHKALVVLGAIPVALASNVLRIVVTAVLMDKVGDQVKTIVFHDLAGWLMMPLALGMMGVELWLLGRLLVEVPMIDPVATPTVSPPLVHFPRSPSPASQQPRAVAP